jgi:hypothetical protein
VPRLARVRPIVCAVLLLLGAGVGRGSVIVELEADGTAVNNTIATAQPIPATAFTLPAPPTVFLGGATATVLGRGGDCDVDFYSFELNVPTPMYFDIDDDPFTFDVDLALFDATARLIAVGSDSFPVDPGSASSLDAFLGLILLQPGTYYLAVHDFLNPPNALGQGSLTFENLVRPDGAPLAGGRAVFGAMPDATFSCNDPQPDGSLPYTLYLTKIPEPSALLLLGAGVAAAVLRRRPSHTRLP